LPEFKEAFSLFDNDGDGEQLSSPCCNVSWIWKLNVLWIVNVDLVKDYVHLLFERLLIQFATFKNVEVTAI
jgi:hypothetical protein